MITFNKQLLESLNPCAEGMEYAETVIKEKGAEVELGSCTDATVSDRLFIAFGLGITVTDILLFISPYDLIEDFKELNKNLIISQWNEDPLMKKLHDTKMNNKKLKNFFPLVDHSFITTNPDSLDISKKYIKNVLAFFAGFDGLVNENLAVNL